MANCVCEVNPVWQPAMRMIAGISNSSPATVTTTVNHLYVTGTIVRISIPQACGMQQLHNYAGTLTSTGPTTFTLNVDTTRFDAFVIPVGVSPHVDVCAQVLPIGEDPYQITAALHNVLG